MPRMGTIAKVSQGKTTMIKTNVPSKVTIVMVNSYKVLHRTLSSVSTSLLNLLTSHDIEFFWV